MNASKPVENLLAQNVEVRRVHDSLSLERQSKFTKFLDDLLDNHNTLYGPDASSDIDHIDQGDLEQFCSIAQTLAQQYVDHRLWHTPWLTRYLLDDVLEGQCTWLIRASKLGAFPEWSMRHWLSSPYRRFVPLLVSLAFVGFCLSVMYWLVRKEYLITAALLGAGMIYFYFIEKPRAWWRRRQKRAQLLLLAQLLFIPLSEIRSSINYDAESIIRRLEACEQKDDLKVASVLFALLKLPSHAGSRQIPTNEQLSKK